MKLSLSRPSSLASIITPIFTKSKIHTRPISYSFISTRPTSLKPKTPLFLKPPTFSTTISELQKWQHWAKTLASSIGSTFLDFDNGPTSENLKREIIWLLEDVLENPKSNFIKNGDFSTNEDVLENPKSRFIKNVDFSTNGDVLVKLRVELEDLYVLWKQRVEERRPFQYIVGCEHWRDLVLSVEEGVLIPRPETEKIVDLVSDLVEGNEMLKEGLWADLGTGSGALAIGIGRVLGSNGRVIASDLSHIAVQVASFNVQRYNLQHKVEIRQGSWFEPLKEAEGELAGLVSNPPYIPSDQISGLQAEVGKHEPRLALDGGEDGMGDLLHLCTGAASMLRPGGYFAFETNGEDQCKFLLNYMETKTKGVFCDLKVISDFAGIQRFVTGFKVK
ncbi:Modification methylase HemK [Heracleum sosnowskyi]|uniref:Modification methylase HemK n=1 Tax=Heracleum sosnowskyi TaxID=360622 RepID=A0AAD8GMI9_9APIA|nr:Modification methylase HemK [Heracleum sosnowskyi]